MDTKLDQAGVEPTVTVEPSGISTTWLLIYTALALFAVYMVNQFYKFTYFWRQGIPGPMPLPLIGNLIPIARKGFLPAFAEWTEKYGDKFGIYMFSMKLLVLGDADIARQVTTKDFSAFQRRTGNEIKIPNMEEGLLTAHGETWKRGRSYMSPAFSGSKLKQLIPIINDKCRILIAILDKKAENDESFEVKDTYGAYVLDNVASCAFGFEADCQRDPNDPFVKNAKTMTDMQAGLGILLRMMLPKCMAPLLDRYELFDLFNRNALNFFADIVKEALKLRKESGPPKQKDFLQLMMESSEGADEAEPDDQVVNDVTKKKIPATTEELMGNSMVFFFAGYDTVSSTLAFTSYAIAKYPEVQAKVQEEIEQFIDPEGDVSYDVVSKLEYLDKVWCEAMRLWPVGFFMERKSNEEVTYNGINIADGQQLYLNVWLLHHNPKYWDQPNKFNPEHFNKEAKESRHPCAWVPFGYGPRNCVGMRFAILESKIVLVHILRKYTLSVDPKTKDMHDPNNLGVADIYPKKEGIHLRLKARVSSEE